MPVNSPKFKGKRKSDAPPIDWLWAAVLERKMVYGYDLKKMADIACVAYPTMREYITKSPWSWSADARNRVCHEFGIEPVQSVRLLAPDIEKGGYIG